MFFLHGRPQRGRLQQDNIDHPDDFLSQRTRRARSRGGRSSSCLAVLAREFPGRSSLAGNCGSFVAGGGGQNPFSHGDTEGTEDIPLIDGETVFEGALIRAFPREQASTRIRRDRRHRCAPGDIGWGTSRHRIPCRRRKRPSSPSRRAGGTFCERSIPRPV